jgi:hypothetical protein
VSNVLKKSTSWPATVRVTSVLCVQRSIFLEPSVANAMPVQTIIKWPAIVRVICVLCVQKSLFLEPSVAEGMHVQSIYRKL